MRPKLLLDEHLPPALSEALKHRGIDAMATVGSSYAGFEDDDLLHAAVVLDRILVTFNNPDFMAALQKRAAVHLNQRLPGVLFIPGKKVRAGEISRLASAIEHVVRLIERGDIDPAAGVWMSV